MNLIEKMTEGDQAFIKGHIKEGFDLLAAGILQKKSHVSLSLEQAIGADTAARRLLARYPEYVKEDILCTAGCRVSWKLYKVAFEFGRNAEKVRIWVPALQTFEAMFSSLFLLGVLTEKIILNDDEKRLGTIAEEMYMGIPQENIAMVMRAKEDILVQPIPLIPDSVEDDYRYFPIGPTRH